MKTNNILAFAGGVIVGLIGGIVISDIYYKKAINDYNDEVTEAVKAVNSYSPKKEEDETPVKKERGKRKERPVVEYNKMYKKDQDDEEEEDETGPQINEEAQKYHEEHKDDPPEIITEDDVQGVPDWFDLQTILYYQYDDTLVNESDDSTILTEEEDALFGDLLMESGFNDNEEEVIHILNPRLDVLYRIEKQFAAYGSIEHETME